MDDPELNKIEPTIPPEFYEAMEQFKRGELEPFTGDEQAPQSAVEHGDGAKCPQCSGKLEQLEYNPKNLLNYEQWYAVRAGDYVCRFCPDNGRSGSGRFAYFWESEVAGAKPAPQSAVDLPTCGCDEMYPGKGHSPNCHVLRAFNDLRAQLAAERDNASQSREEIEALKGDVAAMAVSRECVWDDEQYETSCGDLRKFDKHQELHRHPFCPKCGGRVKIQETITSKS